MPNLRLLGLTWLAFVGACTDANEVHVTLAPEVISSLNGMLGVRATVLADRLPAVGETVDITVDYTDRNGMAHTIEPASGDTSENGTFDATLTGFEWDGFGTVTASIGGVAGTASFAVLDRTPPKVTIIAPAAASVRRGSDIKIQVQVTDEIGISQVFFGGGNQNRDRSQIVSGVGNLTVDFDFQVPDVTPGATIDLFALAEDLSGNQAAAPSITVTVVP